MARTVFVDANLLDGEHPARPGSHLILEGERITAVGTGPIEAGPGDRVIELGGRTLMPGLISCHFHSTYDDITVQPEPLGLEKPPVYLAHVAARNLALALDCGLTSVVSAGAINDDIDAQTQLAIDDGVIPGPRLVAGSRGLDTHGGSTDTESWWWRLGNPGAQRFCNGPDEFRAAVRDEIKRGAQMIKLFPSGGHAGPHAEGGLQISPDELRAACDAAHQRGAKVRAHAPLKEAILACVEAGVDVIDHGDDMDDECLQAMLEAGTFLVPSAFFTRQLLIDPGNLAAATPEQMAPIQAEFDNICRWIPRAQAAGLRLLMGDDYGIVILSHGRYAEELEFYVKSVGMAPLDVIGWATRNGAELLGRAHELGTLTPGTLADLLVVDGDPSVDIAVLQDRRRLHAIVKGGAFHKDVLARP